MKRPQSAKAGFKANYVEGSQSQFIQQYEHNNKINQRKNVKIIKPDLTTNDFARILPKKIYQDKQRLYSQTLQLKQTLNQTVQENMRLKTRIAILQKQKDKLTKNIDNHRESTGNVMKNNLNSRINVYSNNKSGDKQNMIITNLKKMIRQKKQENDYLSQQNTKIKKNIKYTKINELEIQRKMLQDENKRIVALLEEMNNQLTDQEQFQREINRLNKKLESEKDANRQLNQANLKYIQEVEEMEEKIQAQMQKFQGRENKLQRELALTKRKMNEALKRSENLIIQLNSMKEEGNHHNSHKKQGKLIRPMSSNQYKAQNGLLGVKIISSNIPKQIVNQENSSSETLKKIEEENEKLKEQLNKTKQRLQQTQRKVIEQKQRGLSQKNNQVVVKLKTESPNKLVKSKDAKVQTPMRLQQKQNEEKKQQQQQALYSDEQYSSDHASQKQDQYEKYENQFQQQQDHQLKHQSNKKQNKQKRRQSTSEIDQYRKDFEEEEQEQQIFVKEEQKGKKTKKSQDKKKKSNESPSQEKKKKNSTTKYKPDKALLSEIKQLLTYRLKAQRYPYKELKKDILDADQKSFTNLELKTMLTNEPFHLTETYADGFINYCFQQQSMKNKVVSISYEVLLEKLRKVIEEFSLLDEKQEEEMLLKIAQMVTEYPEELEAAFEKIKNSHNTVRKSDMVSMFKKFQLDNNYIEIIIQQLSLCSTDLDHLNFHGFFQRFYVQNLQALQNGQIDQQQIQSSSDQISKNLKQKSKESRLKKLNKEFQDNYDDDVMQLNEGERISLGNSKNEEFKYKDEEIVSDDGPI